MIYLPLGIEVESQVKGQYRWIESNKGPVVIARRWMTAPAEANFDWIKFDQEFALVAYLPTNDGMRFVDMDWVIASLGDIPLPEDYLLSTAIDTMKEGRQDLEAYIDEN
jgi:hypothetical protein